MNGTPFTACAGRPGPSSVRLYCYPYAGGNTTIFRSWARALQPHVHVVPMELPGRGKRIGEKPIADYKALVHTLAQELVDDLRAARDAAGYPPYAIFGHSAGARFGFAAAVEVVRQLDHVPLRCFLSGSSPFHTALREPRRCHLSDDEWIAELRTLGGTPPQVLAEPELMRMLLPILRADFCAIEGSHVDAGLRLPCPLTLVAADRDEDVSVGDVWEWAGYSSAECKRVVLPGDHFSVLRNEQPLFDVIRSGLVDGIQASALAAGRFPNW